jgi:hypothetical protein
MTKRQRDILEALDKRKSQSQTDLNTVWQECGSFGPAVFLQDWGVLVKEGLVFGSPTNDSNQKITGTGRITPRGEEALEVLD